MLSRFVSIDHDTPMLLPPDLRGWVPHDHLVHFIVDAVGLLDLEEARVSTRGAGHAQYPPSLMVGLLIYSYLTGTFSSRKIQRLTYENVAVRYLCANTHPDHDSIGKFRKENRALLKRAFCQILECAARLQVPQVGHLVLSMVGDKILASASKESASSQGNAGRRKRLLEKQVNELLAKAEAVEGRPPRDGLVLPEEVSPRGRRLERLREAVQAMEQTTRERREKEKAASEKKKKRKQRPVRLLAVARKARGKKKKAGA
jgi:transposase